MELFEDAAKPLAKQCQTSTLKKTAMRNDNQLAAGVPTTKIHPEPESINSAENPGPASSIPLQRYQSR